MAIRGTPTTNGGTSTTPSVTVPTGVIANDIVLLFVNFDASAGNITAVMPSGFAALETEKALGPDGGRGLVCWKRATGSDSGSYTFGVVGASNDWTCQCIAFSGRSTSSSPVVNSTNNTASNASPVTATVPTTTAVLGDDLVAFNIPDVNATGIFNVYTSHPSGYTNGVTQEQGFANSAVDYLQNSAAGATGTSTFVFSLTSGASGWYAGRVRIPSAPTGIAFDVAANSADQAAASSYSGSASWNGTNRMLAVDVSLLGPGVTVTAMTYGGANCTFIGKQASVTSFGSVESWRICSSDASAPAAGANTLSVTLSGSLEFSVEWVSYTGVHQTSPTEAFNSAQATNTGSATDASVVITTVADNCWVHAAVSANDTSISAGNTTRNNVAGTLGSGANEDNNAAKTPAGAVTMSYTGMGITTTWTIAGYAIRPLAASNLTATAISSLMLMGLGT